MKNTATPETIDAYIADFTPEVRAILEEVRATIRRVAPEAQEAIKYAMPTFIYHGNLVHFAAFRHHIGFYPAPTGMEAFSEALSPYKTGKGSVQFPLDRPIPFDLIERITRYRMAENLQKTAAKGKGRKKE